jgi:hypothetical protein
MIAFLERFAVEDEPASGAEHDLHSRQNVRQDGDRL